MLIIVDMRLVYSPDDIIDGVKIEFEFAKDVALTHWPADLDCAKMTKAPIYKVFAPECIEGMPSYSQRTTHHNIRQAKGRRSDLQVGSWWERKSNHLPLPVKNIGGVSWVEEKNTMVFTYLWLEYLQK